jgi:ABC-type lipoprotein export system ATPase subunit
MNDPRGSEWRKWDLHIHAPGTTKNDQYQGDNVLELFCERLEQSDVAAFGITDYFSAGSYFAFLAKFRALYPHSTKVFFPNIELCTTDVVNAASEEVNLHIIFNPFLPEYAANINTFLQHLNTSKTGSGSKKIKASELTTSADFQSATTTRDSIKEAFDQTFGPTADLTDHLLVFTTANNDGIRAVRGKQRKALITDELDKFSHGFFGNSGNTQWFLKTDRLENGEQIDPKPVISGCDAHSFQDLDAWLGKVVLQDGVAVKQCTWIKADLSFEGLKQIIFESAERVFIGEEPSIESRVRNNQRRYIESIHIDQIKGYDGRHGSWFVNEHVQLSKELVAIIGNKGSGKSAVTDIIGLLGNSHNQKYERDGGRQEELFSFLNKEKFLKGNCASNFTAHLSWYAGTPDTAHLSDDTDSTVPERVEYLPQKYLEKICANIDDDEFRTKLNQVIFEYVKEADRYDQTTLDSLIAYLTRQTAADIELAKIAVHGANVKVLALERRLTSDYRKDLEEKLRLREADLSAHNGIKPAEIKRPAEGGEEVAQSTVRIRAIDDEFHRLQEEISAYKAEAATVSRATEDLKQARHAIRRQEDALSALRAQYEPLLKKEGLTFDQVISLTVSYGHLDEAIQKRKNRQDELTELLRSEAEISALGLSEEPGAKAAAKSLLVRLDSLAKERKELTDSLDKPNREYQAYVAELSRWELQKLVIEGDSANPAIDTYNWLRNELTAIGTPVLAELATAKEERVAAGKAVFAKKKSLVSFYESVKESIDRELGTHGNDLREYQISIEAGLKLQETLYEQFFAHVNQQVKGSFHGTEEGRSLLQKLAELVVNWQDETEAFQFLATIDEYLHQDKRLNQGSDVGRDVGKQMRQKRDPVSLYDFLFGFDYLETKYDLKIDGKDLKELSPGERGGLLLIFYLMLDRRDIPLVIDQPEDNLDNKSVYEILVTFLKKAKKRRQIIIVTHNPNLAVVADAEQIIHVSIDKTSNRNDFAFESGAIENPKINRVVVDILEGTLPAFDNRRLKYRRQAGSRTRV